MSTNLPKVVKTDIVKKFSNSKDIVTAGKTIETGMSLFGTDMNRSTHYNTLEELQAIRPEVHNQVFDLDRSIYGCLMCIPGTTDISKMVAISNMLGRSWINDDALLGMNEERMIIDHLVSTLPPNRMINLFVSFTDHKINNKRTLKTVLPFILNSDNLEWWAVKYRRKLKKALSHCWGKKMTSAIVKILGKKRRIQKEHSILSSFIAEHLVRNTSLSVYECIAFIFSAWEPNRYTLKLFLKFYKARNNFNEAKGLPHEVIEGIRASYHPTVDKAQTLAVAKSSMTQKGKRLVQNQAKKAGVEVKWDPYAQPLVDLIVYGFKMGFEKDIVKAIGFKSKKAATVLPFKYDHVGIICDDSFSMSGSDAQKLRALAVTYATVEMLKRTGEKFTVYTTTNRKYKFNNPAGETDIASPFIQMLKADPDAIFIVSDGYENAPEGRFDEVLKIARDKLSLATPIYHFNPVSAAESKVALKRLSDDIPLTPVSNPEKMGLTLFKTMLSVDPRGGIIELFNMILPTLEKTKKLYARSNSHTLTQTRSITRKVKEA